MTRRRFYSVVLLLPLVAEAFHATPSRVPHILSQSYQRTSVKTATTASLATQHIGYGSPSRRPPVAFLSSSADPTGDYVVETPETNEANLQTNSSDIETANEQTSFLSRIKALYKRGKKVDRNTLTSLGTNVLLAYGFISNVFGCISVSAAWYISSRKTGLSPLAPGQWKTFGAVYAGFYVALSIMRPMRFVMSMTLSPLWDRAIKYCQDKLKLSKVQSIAAVLFFVNFCGTASLMALGILGASALSGVPIWAK